MTDTISGTATFQCPICGKPLVVDRSGPEESPNDRVVCPVHGDIGSREQIDAAGANAIPQAAGDAVSDRIGEMLGKSGFHFERVKKP